MTIELHGEDCSLRLTDSACYSVSSDFMGKATLVHEVGAWEKQRNEQQATIDWRFSVTEAREKLKRLYPSPSS